MTDWDDATAEWYAEKYGEYPTNRLAVDALELEANMVVVDIGCGTGAALRHAAARVSKGLLIGIDPVPRMIELARERTTGHAFEDRIEFRQGSAERLPVDDFSVDVVLAFDSFDHWQNKDLGLAEVLRVLKSSGSLVAVKDGWVPGGETARSEFVKAATCAGFLLLSAERVSSEGIEFDLWVLGR